MVDICEHGLVERLQREGGQRNSHGHHLRCAGHHDFLENMITGGSQADVVLIMVPASGSFTTAIAKSNHRAGEIHGLTRHHPRLISLLGVKQIRIGIDRWIATQLVASRLATMRWPTRRRVCWWRLAGRRISLRRTSCDADLWMGERQLVEDISEHGPVERLRCEGGQRNDSLGHLCACQSLASTRSRM